MDRRSFLVLLGASGLAMTETNPSFAAANLRADGDPCAALLDPWTGTHGGVPPFDRIRGADFKPALLQAMERFRTEIGAITAQQAAPDFANTIVALEDAGRAYDQVQRLFRIYATVLNDAAMQAVEAELSPLIAAFMDEIVQNEALFKRIDQVNRGRENSGLDPEQQRLVHVHYRRFFRQGAGLDAAGKARMREINQRLASLFTTFRQHLLGDEEFHALVVDKAGDLAGLPQALREAAAQAAAASGLSGKWAFANTRSAIEPLLCFAERRKIRERAWYMWTRRGSNGDQRDNRKVAGEILQLRAERARLLGYATHAHWAVEDNMARTPEATMALMQRVWEKALVRARQDIADMQVLADADGVRIKPWDHRYYAEKLRRIRHDIDQEEVKPYLTLERMIEALFWAAGQVYGLEMARLEGVPVYHPDVGVYEVRRRGSRIGLWYLDPYARAGKVSGAWMNEYRSQESFRQPVTPIVSNNANFIPAPPGQPILVSWDDAVTLFHEFGHALHGLLSDVRYRTLAGTATVLDFVEFPSMMNEYWLETPELLTRFARHHETGAPMPPALVERIMKARNFNQGFLTVEYLASAIYDMKIHLAATPDKRIDPVAFERSLLEEIGCPPEIIMRHRPTGFAHIFASDDYAAGYYAYLWAEVMTADAHEAFTERGGLYDQSACRRLEDTIMRVGNSVPPEDAFRRFRGRDVDAEALLRRRGFVDG